jgi:hypothetical protein
MRNKKIWLLLGNIVLVLWSLAVLVIFMYFPGALSHMHRASLYDFLMLPERFSTIPSVTYLWDMLSAILGMFFFAISCISLGARLANIRNIEKALIAYTNSQRGILIATYFLMGNAIFSIIFLTVASLAQISKGYSLLILVIGFLSGLTKLKSVRPLIVHSETNYGKIFLSFSAIVLVVSLLQSASHLSYDASAIYFSVAKLTSLQHRAGYFLENTFPVSVLHSTISYTAIMQIFGDQSARLISWLFGTVNIVIAIAIADLVGASSLTRRILPILILTSTAFLDQMGDGKVELFSSAYALIAIYWLAAKSKGTTQTQMPFFLSGCFMGFSCILRPYNVFLLGIFVLVYFVFQPFERAHLSQAVQRILWMVRGAVGFAVYHLILNKILLGSPFAFWTSVIGINPEGPWDFNAQMIWIYRLLYPFVVTFKNTGASLGNISPLVLVFLPILTMHDIRNRLTFQRNSLQMFMPAAIALISWVFLFFAIVEVRYVLFLWIILFIPVAEVAARALESENKLIKNVVSTSIVLLMGFILIRSIFLSFFTYSPIKAGDPQCFEDSICGHVSQINHLAAPGERVLVLSGYRYYLRNDLFACSTNQREYKILKDLTSQNMDAFWREVYRQGYGYIAYEEGYAMDHILFSQIPNPSNTPDWIKLVPIFGKPGDLQIAYRIDVTTPPFPIETMCIKSNDSGIWEVQTITP